MNKTVVITGVGRMKGIGATMSRALAKNGYNIIFTYWSEYDAQVTNDFSKHDIKNFMEEIKSYNVKCYALELDLSKTESINTLLDEAKRLGNVYGLINKCMLFC